MKFTVVVAVMVLDVFLSSTGSCQLQLYMYKMKSLQQNTFFMLCLLFVLIYIVKELL